MQVQCNINPRMYLALFKVEETHISRKNR